VHVPLKVYNHVKPSKTQFDDDFSLDSSHSDGPPEIDVEAILGLNKVTKSKDLLEKEALEKLS